MFSLFYQVSNEPGTRYNVPLMNALVLYVGTQAITYIHSKSGTPSMSTITHSSHMDIFQNLAVDLDTEGTNSPTNMAKKRRLKFLVLSSTFFTASFAHFQSRGLVLDAEDILYMTKKYPPHCFPLSFVLLFSIVFRHSCLLHQVTAAKR